MEFELGDRGYRTRKMDGFTQIKLAKRMAPLIPMYMLFQQTAQTAAAPKVEGDDAASPVPEGMRMSPEQFRAIAPRLSEALHSLDDSDVEYILKSCLSVTQVDDNNIWCDVWNKRANACQYQWIDGIVMLTIAVYVILDNIGSFSNALGAPGQAAPGAQATQP